jgi:hypothetical protein
MSNEWINDLGEILESKQGKIYIKFKKDCEIKAGDAVFLTKFKDDVQQRVEAGFLTEVDAESLLERCSFIKYKLTKPPRDKK